MCLIFVIFYEFILDIFIINTYYVLHMLFFMVGGCCPCDACCVDGCSCVEDLNTGQCYSSCAFVKSKQITYKYTGNMTKWKKITLKSKVNFRARNVSIEQISLLLEKSFPNRVLIHATKINSRIRKRFVNKEIGQIAKSLGIIIK